MVTLRMNHQIEMVRSGNSLTIDMFYLHLNKNQNMAYKELTPVFKLIQVAQRRKPSDSKAIAEATGFSQSHVANVLAGRRFNDTITNTAYRMTNRRQTLATKLANMEG